MNPVRLLTWRPPAALLAMALSFALATLNACEGSRSGTPRTGDESAASPSDAPSGEAAKALLLRELPHAAFVRFQEVKGEGLSRESWEAEILQADSDIWFKGSIRGSGRSVPVKESMPLEEFHSFWEWIRGLDLDDVHLIEDSTSAQPGWKRTLVVDIVESGNRRIRTRNTWTRPLVGRPELVELEKRLHDRLVAAGERELERMAAEAAKDSAKTEAERAASDSAKAGLPSSFDEGTK